MAKVSEGKEPGYAAVRALGVLGRDAYVNALIWTAVDAALDALINSRADQRDEAAMEERERIAADIWKEERRASEVLRSAPVEMVSTSAYSNMSGRIVGLQRARDIALGVGES